MGIGGLLCHVHVAGGLSFSSALLTGFEIGSFDSVFVSSLVESARELQNASAWIDAEKANSIHTQSRENVTYFERDSHWLFVGLLTPFFGRARDPRRVLAPPPPSHTQRINTKADQHSAGTVFAFTQL